MYYIGAMLCNVHLPDDRSRREKDWGAGAEEVGFITQARIKELAGQASSVFPWRSGRSLLFRFTSLFKRNLKQGYGRVGLFLSFVKTRLNLFPILFQ